MSVDSISILKERGLRVTPQRISILDILAKGRHYTGEQVYSRIKGKIPTISLSTVYNVLDTLEKSGLLNSFEVNGTRWYDSNIETHVNVYCEDTDEVIDLDIDLTAIMEELKKKGIDVKKISVVAHSSCRSNRK
ncbi:MAG: Fur family transcriptional regulator [Thermoplasmata archaeon]